MTKADDGLVSIGQLAESTGVSSRTIRYYEELGILPEPPRTDGGTRKYGPEYRFYVEGAIALKELGFTLDEIKLVGRLALGRSMTAKQHRQAADVINTKREALEHKIRLLDRLYKILSEREQDSGAVQDPARLSEALTGNG